MTIGFYIAAGLMVIAAITEFALGIDAEGETLEDIATPLTAEGAPHDEVRRGERFARRPGPQSQTLRSGGWSADAAGLAALARDTDIDREVGEIVGALDEAGGPLARRELADRTSSRLWGAGRFSTALGTAMARGEVRRVGRGRYEATDNGSR